MAESVTPSNVPEKVANTQFDTSSVGKTVDQLGICNDMQKHVGEKNLKRQQMKPKMSMRHVQRL